MEKNYLTKFNRGFTLLEMVVSTGIFFVVVILAVGLAIAVSDAQIKASNLQTIQDNVRFSLELMTKEIRTGFDYALTSLCGGSSELSFEATSGLRVYFLDTTTKRIMRGTNCADATPFTSDNMIVDDLRFIVRGNSPGPNDGQPTITISMTVRSISDKQKLESSMNLQTTIVQRTKDL